MVKTIFVKLVDKYLADIITKEESEILEKLLKDPKNKALFKDIVKDDYIVKTKNSDFNEKDTLHRVLQEINKSPKNAVFFLRPMYKYAAAVLFILGFGILFRFMQEGKTNAIITEKVVESQVKLLFDDGSQRLITDTEVATITDNDSIILGQVDKGIITYTQNSKDIIRYNTLKTPYGKKFQLVLSDGTHVHLNAGSKLRFPTTFSEGEKRTVFLDGEAFFIVAKDSKHPFIVNSNNLNVEVLGTEFNVSAYNDDHMIKTTLREGSVKVFDNKNMHLLHPNEQSTWDKTTAKLNKKKVDVSKYTGWIEGKLVFDGDSFEKIIKQLERYYNVKINNHIKVLNKERFIARFNGETVEQVLIYFSESYDFTFKKEGNIITIK